MNMRSWIRRSAAAGLCLALAAAVGCGRSAADRDGIKPQSYADDGYLGRTSAHAGIPGRTMTDTYAGTPGGAMADSAAGVDGRAGTGAFAADSRYMKLALAGVDGVADASIAFSGEEVYVSLRLESDVAPRERPTVTTQAATTLRFNFPQYAFHVTALP